MLRTSAPLIGALDIAETMSLASIVCLLDHWQSLIGSLLGGLLGLWAALVVANRVERREDLSAGKVVVAGLVQFRAAATQLAGFSERRGITDEEQLATFYAEKLVWLRPKLVSNFDAHVARLMSVNDILAAHLVFFQAHQAELEAKIRFVESAMQQIQEGRSPDRDRMYIVADAKMASRAFFQSALHADYAEYLISKMVLARHNRLNRIRAMVLPDEKTKAARTALQGSDI